MTLTLYYRDDAEASPEAFGSEAAYHLFCARGALEPRPGGYGFMQAVDDEDQHWTLLTSDLDNHRGLFWATDEQSTEPMARHDLYTGLTLVDTTGLVVPHDLYTIMRAGWPHEW